MEGGSGAGCRVGDCGGGGMGWGVVGVGVGPRMCRHNVGGSHLARPLAAGSLQRPQAGAAPLPQLSSVHGLPVVLVGQGLSQVEGQAVWGDRLDGGHLVLVFLQGGPK